MRHKRLEVVGCEDGICDVTLAPQEHRAVGILKGICTAN